MDKKLPQNSAELLHYNKNRIILTTLLSLAFASLFNVRLKPNFSLDFIFLVLLHIADTITTRFGLEFIPDIHEVNPSGRVDFNELGYFKTLLKGIIFISFLIIILYLLNLSITLHIKSNFYLGSEYIYTVSILALYLLFAPQPFLNLIEIIKAIRQKKFLSN